MGRPRRLPVGRCQAQPISSQFLFWITGAGASFAVLRTR